MAKSKTSSEAEIARAVTALRNSVLSPQNKRKLASNLTKHTLNTILKRTAKGTFSRRSSGSRAKRYNERYARETGKNPNGPVNLRLTGDMLEDMYGVIELTKDTVYSFIDFRTAESAIKAEYHHPLGSGRSQVMREFVYLTDGERSKVIEKATKFLTTSNASKRSTAKSKRQLPARDAKGRFISRS